MMLDQKGITKMKIFLIFFSISFHISAVYSQQANYWYFGDHASVNFSSGNPTIENNSQMYSIEGVASISDNNGQLLFYTNGITVWNKQHQQMINGFGLNGNQSSTQSGVIVPHPYNDSIYYIFTVDAIAGSKGVCYSLVNINRGNGLGEVTQKNITLLTPTCEKITAVRHCNNKDIWVITRRWNSDQYYSYLVSSGGINSIPVISSTGFWVGDPVNINSGIEAQGYLKVSPNGKKIAAAHTRFSEIELLDFNNSTGILNNLKRITPFSSTVYDKNNYGLEYSPNNKFLYISSSGQDNFGNPTIYSLLLQYDLSSNDESQINQTRFVVDSNASMPYLQRGAIQLASNGKLYSLRAFTHFLDCINEPNLSGINCNFQPNQIYLGNTAQAILGLPNFIQSFFKPKINSSGDCLSQNIVFSISELDDIDSVKWNFGDVGSGLNNYSTLFTPSHFFSTSGSFQVQLQIFSKNNCDIDTVQKSVYAGFFSFNLGSDTTICEKDTLKLKVNLPSASFKWNNGSTGSELNVTEPGTYWVNVNLGNCFATDTIVVSFRGLPQFTLGNDSVICPSSSVLLSPNPNPLNVSYLWSTNATIPTITASLAGDYWLRLTDNYGCRYRDTIKITYSQLPGFSLGADKDICDRDTLLLNATVTGATSYLWSTGAITPTIKTYQTGIYWCDVNKDDCTYRDSMILAIKPIPIFNLGNDTTLCEGKTIVLDATYAGATYLWQDGGTNATYLVTKKGQYYVTATINGCAIRDDIKISYDQKPKFSLGPDKLFCIGSSIMLDPTIDNVSYLWQDGAITKTYRVTQPGLYYLTASNFCGTSTDSIILNKGVCELYMPAAFTPDGNGRNDIFKAGFGDNVVEFEIKIFNRYGQLVFRTTDKNKGWDGTVNGKQQQAGTYVWAIRYKIATSSLWQDIQGTVILLR